MGLIIHRRAITNIDDDALIRQFGRSYERGERVGDTIEWYIIDTVVHPYPDMASFAAAVVGLSQGSHLVIQRTHPTHPGPYRITMTGSRTGDYAAANAKASLTATPGNYTWHHKEGIIFHSKNNIECDMYLIETAYHGTIRHRGGVYEYEQRTNSVYG